MQAARQSEATDLKGVERISNRKAVSQGARRVQADTHEMREDIPKDMRQFNSAFARAKAARRGWRQMTRTAFLGTNPKVVYFRLETTRADGPVPVTLSKPQMRVPPVPRSWGPGMPQRLAAWKLGCDDQIAPRKSFRPPEAQSSLAPRFSVGKEVEPERALEGRRNPDEPIAFHNTFSSILAHAPSAAARLQPIRRSFTSCKTKAPSALRGAVTAKKSARSTACK